LFELFNHNGAKRRKQINTMLNKEEKYRVLVADSDVGFLKKISSILGQLVKNAEAVVVSEPDINNIDEVIQNRTDVAFLDKSYFTNEKLLSGLYKANPKCLMVLMISDEGGYSIKEVIKTFKNHNQVFMGEYLLKDNYPDYIIKVICRKYLEKVICTI
jgi:hypothetical protein